MKGGISRFVGDICLHLALRHHEVTVHCITNQKIDELEEKRYRVIKTKSSKRLSSLGIILKTLLLAKKQFDLYFIGRLKSTSAIGVYILSMLKDVPIVLLLHGHDLSLLRSRFYSDRFFAHLLLKKSTLILANSIATANRKEMDGVKSSKIKVLNPGVDTNLFYKRSDSEIYKNKHKLKDKRVIITVSRLVERKGHRFVIEAIAILRKELSNLHYIIIGNGPEKEMLTKFAKKMDVSDMVSFLGEVEDYELPIYYSLSEIFIMPTTSVGTDYEGFGMVYLEANACGLPVIATKTGGVMDAVIDGQTGILIRERDVKGISYAIKKLLNDDTLRKKLGEAGRKKAKEMFSWTVVIDRLEGYLRRCLAES